MAFPGLVSSCLCQDLLHLLPGGRVSPGLSSSPFCALGSPMRAATVVAWGHGGCLGQAVLS